MKRLITETQTSLLAGLIVGSMAFNWRRAVLAVGLSVALLTGAPSTGRAAPKTERVSLTSSGAQASAFSGLTAISANGRFVVFISDADNLVLADTNDRRDVFVRDRVSGVTERVSVTQGGGEANDSSFSGIISPDGRFVAFESDASNLVPGDSNGARDIFVRDRVNGTTERVSVATGGGQANSSSTHPAISADGLVVAFQSRASNPGDPALNFHIFVRDRTKDTTELVSITQTGGPGLGTEPVVSADGRYVAFRGPGDLLPGSPTNNLDIYVRDRVLGKTERVSVGNSNSGSNSFEPSISAYGRYVAYSTIYGGAGGVFVRDRVSGGIQRVDVAQGGTQPNAKGRSPVISADGRFVAFSSDASNLVTGDNNQTTDIFLHDRALATTERVSLPQGGGEANGVSSYPAISADGRFVAFTSAGTNLVTSDTNGVEDSFVRDRATIASVQLSVANAQVSEGSGFSFDRRSLVFTVKLSATSNQDVFFRFSTDDVTARAGTDYKLQSGVATIPAGSTAVNIAVSIIGDTVPEPTETMNLNIDLPFNATIADGQGLGTIRNDDVGLAVGTAALTPEDSVVGVGEHVNLSLTWTHPVGWRQLDSVDLLILDDDGAILAVRWHEAENSFSLFNPAEDRFVQTAEAGSLTQFETSAVTLHLQESTGGGPPGQTVAIDYSLTFKPQAAGRTFSVEAFATDDAGNLQGFEPVGTVTVLPPPLAITSFSAVGGTGGQAASLFVIANATGTPNVVHQFQASPDMTNWTTLQSATANAGGLLGFSVTVPAADRRKFFRIRTP